MSNPLTLRSKSETSKSTVLYLTLVPYFTYMSISSNEPLWYSRMYWPGVYKQPEVIKDWNELSLEDFKFYNLSTMRSDPDQALDTLFWYKYPTLSSFFFDAEDRYTSMFSKIKITTSPYDGYSPGPFANYANARR